LLDEPTAALERRAVERLFERIHQLVANGLSVLYISHHLEEVFEVCNDVTILRDGEVVLKSPIADINKDQMVAAMVGTLTRSSHVSGELGRLIQESGEQPVQRERAGLVVEDLHVASDRGDLHGISLAVRPGERVGVTGLLGAGVATIGRAVAGSAKYNRGSITVDERAVVSGRRDLALKAGIGYIPENRQIEGFVGHLGVGENATMTITNRLASSIGILNPRRRDAAAVPLANALSLVTSGMKQPAEELSGGNQQKVTIIRALISNPSIIVAITPTRGVDVASKSLVLSSLLEASQSTGAGLLICSDELDDLTDCDRVIVLFRGQIFAEFTNAPFDREALIAATEGISVSERRAS
jgi:simple sugar transport system ATP-binding protein